MKKLLKKIVNRILLTSKRYVAIKVAKVDYHGILEGQNIVITGGARGIGFSMAKKFVSEGAKVLITGRNEDALKQAVEIIGGDNIGFFVFDISKVDNFDNFLLKCENRMGEINSLVLNAGISLHEGNFTNVTPESYDSQFSVNLRANYFLSQSFIRSKMLNNREANILFVSSETGAKSNDLPYGLTKVAINSLVGGLARRVYQRGIRINAIAPGITYTDMKKKRENDGNYAIPNAAGRFLLPDEISEVACFILSDASRCITGEILYCDAGSHLKVNGSESNYSL